MLERMKSQKRLTIPSLKRFASDDRGAITAFTMVSFMAMFLAVGMAVDFIRHEANRAELQDALDRGVLAAAASGNINPEAVIRDYLKATNFVGDGYKLEVQDLSTFANRHIQATLGFTTQTMALKLAGISELNIGATSVAYQGVSDIEISLALDISGSMSSNDTTTSTNIINLLNTYEYASKLDYTAGSVPASRLDVLRVSAAQFIDTVLNSQNASTTSVNLIPFSGHVNLGHTMFNRLRSNYVHNYSRCLEVNSGEYASTALPPNNSRPQVPHFQWFYFEADRGNQAEWGWCPSNKQEVEYLSNDADVLKERISDFIAHDGTGTQVAMHYALALLDPDFNDHVDNLIDANEVISNFSDRPYAFDDEEAMKVIVLMSDGRTRYQQRPNWWKYNSASERSYLAQYKLPQNWSQLSYTSSRNANEAQARADLLTACQTAKDEGVIVFTIGFDLVTGDSSQLDLENCASSASNHFDVDGANLAEAFASIAVSISKLKLTQ